MRRNLQYDQYQDCHQDQSGLFQKPLSHFLSAQGDARHVNGSCYQSLVPQHRQTFPLLHEIVHHLHQQHARNIHGLEETRTTTRWKKQNKKHFHCSCNAVQAVGAEPSQQMSIAIPPRPKGGDNEIVAHDDLVIKLRRNDGITFIFLGTSVI